MNENFQDELNLLLDQEETNLTSAGRERLQELLNTLKQVENN